MKTLSCYKAAVFALFLTLTATLAAAEKPLLQIVTGTSDQTLQLAYEQLKAGSLQAATTSYRQFLQKNPHHPDALLALTALSTRQGRASEARFYQEQALVAAPLDPAVQAELLNLPSQPAAAGESRLKILIEQHPRSAPLHFSLGNLLARQQRWAEAQAAYFHASAADNDNPDYLFNLAVSLEQIKQTQPARIYYRRAIEAAASRPAAFRTETAEQRWQALAP